MMKFGPYHPSSPSLASPSLSQSPSVTHTHTHTQAVEVDYYELDQRITDKNSWLLFENVLVAQDRWGEGARRTGPGGRLMPDPAGCSRGGRAEAGKDGRRCVCLVGQEGGVGTDRVMTWQEGTDCMLHISLPLSPSLPPPSLRLSLNPRRPPFLSPPQIHAPLGPDRLQEPSSRGPLAVRRVRPLGLPRLCAALPGARVRPGGQVRGHCR
jgi:hypothetical protein